MEGAYYNNPTFPYAEDQERLEETIDAKFEENDSRNDLNNFTNKDVIIYASFGNSMIWRDKVFNGQIKSFKNHYIVLKNENNKLLIIPINYINFIEIT